MEIKVSEKTGYCKGVNQAVQLAEKALSLAKASGRKAYCLGSLVHNDLLKTNYEEQGLIFINSPKGLEPGILLISAHGTPEKLRRSFVEAGFEIIDGTCQNIIQNKQRILKMASMGYCIVIIGIPGHSEVNCLQGVELFPSVPVTSYLVSNEEDLEKIPDGLPLFVVSQTTAKKDVFLNLVEKIKQRFDNVEVQNTLCPSPLVRQQQLLKLCESCDGMVVVGGKKSANTNALVDIAEKQGVKAYRVEYSHEIPEEVYTHKCVGVASGSSTPESEILLIIEELKKHV